MTGAEILALIAALTSSGKDIMVYVAQLIAQFKTMADEGRLKTTPAEDAAMVAARDAARAGLKAAIDAAPDDDDI